MATTIIQLHGGPWDGQTLSTDAADEANACFAHAMLALTGGRVGGQIPLISPASQQRIDAGIGRDERSAIKPHAYEIVSVEREADVTHITANCQR